MEIMFNRLNKFKHQCFPLRCDGNTWVASSHLCGQFVNNPEFPFLVSFSRTGSHWLRMLMELYFNKPSLVRLFYYPKSRDFTCYHTHDMDLSVQRANVIYLYRNPVDTIFSQMKYYNEDLSDIIRIRYWTFLYGQHLAKWLFDEKFTKKKVILTYEGMQKNLSGEFNKLCSFFDVNFDAPLVKRISHKVTKEKLKAQKISDSRVIQLSNDYEECRKTFKKNHSAYIHETINQINGNLSFLWSVSI